MLMKNNHCFVVDMMLIKNKNKNKNKVFQRMETILVFGRMKMLHAQGMFTNNHSKVHTPYAYV
jgi:hypothetical protein